MFIRLGPRLMVTSMLSKGTGGNSVAEEIVIAL